MKYLLILLSVLFSPDGRNKIEVSHGDGAVSYVVSRDGRPIMKGGPVTLSVGNDIWGCENRPARVIKGSADESFVYPVPRKTVAGRDYYNSLTLRWHNFDVDFRAYNEGVAYRFVGRKKGFVEIGPEKGEFLFDTDAVSYTLPVKDVQNWFEENYKTESIGNLQKGELSILPVLVKTAGFNVMLGEADVYNYSASHLKMTDGGFALEHALYPSKEEIRENGNKRHVTERESYIVRDNTKRTFPWRVIGIYDTDADMFMGDLPYLLSRKTKEDWSWIKPGKALWDWWNHRNIINVPFESGINTETYLYLIDYASNHHIEYILIDEGWSSPDNLLDINPAVDMDRICAHAKEKGVGVCLWAKWMNVEKQMTEAFDAFADWGVRGVKIDFMDRNDAVMVNFFETVAVEAAKRHILIDFHGSYPNEGMRAKYPNLMTREAVLGLEYNKWSTRCTPQHQLMIPFIRQWAGPMDFTPGSMQNAQPKWFRAIDGAPMSQGTRCHQMAMFVVYESPLQMLSDTPSNYDANPEWLPFLEKVPTVWEETRVLDARLGETIAVARRSGEKWFLGVMHAGKACEITLPLDFLADGEYLMFEYRDGVNANLNGNDFVRAETAPGNTLKIRLQDNGGYVGIITPRLGSQRN